MDRIALADYAASFETYGAAIYDARRKGYRLGKYADPTEGERIGLTDKEAADVAHEDIGLVFVAVD